MSRREVLQGEIIIWSLEKERSINGSIQGSILRAFNLATVLGLSVLGDFMNDDGLDLAIWMIIVFVMTLVLGNL